MTISFKFWDRDIVLVSVVDAANLKMEQVFFRLHSKIYNFSSRYLNRHTRRLIEASALIVAISCIVSLALLHTKYITKSNLAEDNFLLHVFNQQFWIKETESLLNNPLPNPRHEQIRTWTQHIKSRYDLVLLRVIEHPTYSPLLSEICNDPLVDPGTCGSFGDHESPLQHEKIIFEDSYVSARGYEISPTILLPHLYPSSQATNNSTKSLPRYLPNSTLVNSYIFSYKRHTIMYLQDTVLKAKGLFETSQSDGEDDLMDSVLPRQILPLSILELQYYPQAHLRQKHSTLLASMVSNSTLNTSVSDHRLYAVYLEGLVRQLLNWYVGTYDVPMQHWIEQSLAYTTGGYLYSLQRKEMQTITPSVVGSNKRSVTIRQAARLQASPVLSTSTLAAQQLLQQWPPMVQAFIATFPGENVMVAVVHSVLCALAPVLPASVNPLGVEGGAVEDPSLPYNWSDYAFFRLGMIFSTSFLLFIGSTLISYILRETQERMLKFTYLLQYHITHQLPYLPLVFLHVTENLVFVPILMGIYFFLFEFYSDQLLAFLVLLVVWMGEVFSVLSLRSKPSIYYFPKYFALLFFVFHFYFFTFPHGFTYPALLTIYSFLFQLMCHLWNEYEVPAIESGLVSSQRPRMHITTTMQTVAAATNSMLGMMMPGTGGQGGGPGGAQVGGRMAVPMPPTAPGMRQMIQQQRMRNAAAAAAISIGSYSNLRTSTPRIISQPIQQSTTSFNATPTTSASPSPTAAHGAGQANNGADVVISASTGSSKGRGGGRNRSNSNSSTTNQAVGVASIYESIEARRLRLATTTSSSTPNATSPHAGPESQPTAPRNALMYEGSGKLSRNNSFESTTSSLGGYGTLGTILHDAKHHNDTVTTNPTTPHPPANNSMPPPAVVPPAVSPMHRHPAGVAPGMGYGQPQPQPYHAMRLTSDSLPKIEVNRIEWLLHHNASGSGSGSQQSVYRAPVKTSLLPDGGQQVFQKNIRGPASRTNTEDEFAEVIGNFIDEEEYANSLGGMSPPMMRFARNQPTTETSPPPPPPAPVVTSIPPRPTPLVRMNTTSTTGSAAEYGYSNSNFNIFSAYHPTDEDSGSSKY